MTDSEKTIECLLKLVLIILCVTQFILHTYQWCESCSNVYYVLLYQFYLNIQYYTSYILLTHVVYTIQITDEIQNVCKTYHTVIG